MIEFKRIRSDLVFEGHRVKVYNDVLELPDGSIVNYDLVKNRNGAGVLLVDDDGMLIFVKQYRTVVNQIQYEIAAGCQDNPDEDFEVCARREAEEETGYVPENLYFVNYMVSAVGLLDERTAVYVGTNLKKGNMHRDPEEFIDVIKISPDKALQMIYTNEITDSKTVIAIFAYHDMKNRGLL